MRLSWNEIRVRASAFSEKWADAGNENSDTQTFYNQFFEVFGLRRESVGVYEERVKNIKGNTGFIDLFWPGTLIVEQKSAGRDLVKAEKQAFDYILQIKERDRPRYVLVSDFKVFQLRDLATRETLEFALEDLHDHVQKFGFMIGVERREFKDQDPVNIKASELVGRLHDALEESGFEGRDLEVFLVQIVFCLFADDTGVFQPKDLFLRFLEDRTSEDGSDLGPKLAQLFQTLDTPESKRSKNLDDDLAAFPYINGRLFERHTRIPSFDSDMREKLIEASRFDWAPISPAIFGALFQSVMDSKERRKKGAHYTTEKNIYVDQFYGIELEEFPARIAETAMWMMDHIMNNALSLAFGQNYARIPLDKAANIVHGDALEVDWETVLPAVDCSYVLGNPPFIGQSYQSPEQRLQMARIIDAPNGKAGSLDYVGAWFIKAGVYINEGGKDPAHIAFVSTNSITQGEMVAQLWPILFQRYKLEISFAHRTFEWGSDAKGKAHVHCVIVGLSHRVNQPEWKRLFSYDDIKGEPEETQFKYLSPYLFDASGLKDRNLTVLDRKSPITERPIMMRGVQSTDGGYYIFRGEEYTEFLNQEPNSKSLLNPYIGAAEFINGKERWILDFRNAAPAEVKKLPYVIERISQVKNFRAKSKKAGTRRLSNFPMELEGKAYPETPFLIVPRVSSERRQYHPIGYEEPPVIPSDALIWGANAALFDFAIITATMHMGWLRYFGGRLKSDYRYSVGVVYNTFPWPALDNKSKETLTKTGQAILDARAAHPDATLADLYDPDAMPANLRKAHMANDKAVDRLYRKKPFESERERVEHLFMLYEQLQSPILAAAKPKPSKRRAKTIKTS